MCIEYSASCQPSIYRTAFAESLESIEAIMAAAFGKEPPKYYVSIDPDFESPQCCYYQSPAQIRLQTDGIHECQAFYQFCHELCHLFIGPNGYDRVSWLEETICELASLYFMKAYAPWTCFSIHEHLRLQFRPEKYTPFNLADLYDSQSCISQYLSKCNCDRKRNRYIALALLPVAEEFNEDFWRFFSSLSNIEPGLTLETAIGSLSRSTNLGNEQMNNAKAPSDISASISRALNNVSREIQFSIS